MEINCKKRRSIQSMLPSSLKIESPDSNTEYRILLSYRVSRYYSQGGLMILRNKRSEIGSTMRWVWEIWPIMTAEA